MSSTHKNSRGFTLIEVIIAIALITVGILSLYSLHYSSINTNMKAQVMTTATSWATDKVEILLSQPFDCTPYEVGCHDLDDVNGDGTFQDTDNDGIDDVGTDREFGLNNNTKATADHFLVSPDGNYTVMWNVAVDTPVPDSKTIRVIVRQQGDEIVNSIPMTYIKSEY